MAAGVRVARPAALTCGDKAGTVAGYSRHRKQSEPPCEPCRQAWAKYAADRRNRHRKAGLPPGHPAHGTLNGYVELGCRCPRCKSANRAAARKGAAQRKQALPPAGSPLHGLRRTYVYGCRCEKCRAAESDYQRRRRGR